MPLRGELDRQVADNLVQLAHSVRPEWQTAGLRSAITTALARAGDYDLADLAYAVVTCAADKANRTPAVLTHDGPHWRVPIGLPHDRTGECATCSGNHGPDAPHATPPSQRSKPDRIKAILDAARVDAAQIRESLCRHGIPPEHCHECKPKTEGDSW